MPVHTQRSPKNPTDVRDHYRDLVETASSNSDPSGYRAMIRLIDRLVLEFQTTDIWLTTSHNHLVLSNSPSRYPYLVTVQGILFKEEQHFLSYLLPDSANPFPSGDEMHLTQPEVTATAVGLEQAIQYIRIAMRECGGWPHSMELSC